MYFKKLELIGFKSFCDKTTINFEPGVTAVVGPNGCGKSNISDAIRWVLGEQSAKSLRGSSMEDVIFNGSSLKEPLNLAEVSLTFSNESKLLPIDYDEVTISRRLYRSGESEYLINKNIVRLKDIQELLMGTGIGTESYSVIEQGKMDVILSSKPEERREIFEEAAGITKFKAKKKEALRKLEQTDSNLLRVNDIIVEVKRQIGSIERQAKKAENYKIEFEKMKEMDLRVAGHELADLEAKREAREEDLQTLKKREEEHLANVRTIDQAYDEKRRETDELDALLKENQTREVETAGQIRAHQDRSLLNRERIGEFLARQEQIRGQIAIVGKRVEEFSEEYRRLDEEFASVRKEEEEGRAFLESVEGEFQAIEKTLEETASRKESLNWKLLDMANQKAHIQTELAKIHAEKNSVDHRLQRLRQEEDSVRREEGEVSAELAQSQTQVQTQETVLGRKLGDKAVQEEELSATESLIRENEERLNALSAEESGLGSKLDVLRDLHQRHEGFSGGVVALREAKNAGREALAGMVGLVADLIEVRKGYELAAEAALESFLQAVVFQDDESVLGALDFLRETRKGRALLLSQNYRKDGGGGRATVENAEPILDAVSPHEAVEPLVRNLLEHVYVVRDAKRAFELSREHRSAVFVTPEGERFEGRIAMGGSLSQQADLTLVGRESRLKETETALAGLSEAKRGAQEKLDKDRAARERLEAAIRALSEDIQALQVEAADERRRLKNVEERKEKLVEELAVLATEVAEVLGQQESLDHRERDAHDRLAVIREDESSAGEEVGALEELLKQKAREKEGLLVRLAETRSKQEHCTGRREKIEKDRHWIEASRKNEESQRDLFQKETEELSEKKNQLENENRTLESESVRLGSVRDGILQDLEGVRLRRETALRGIEGIQKERDERHKFFEEIREKTHALDLENTQIRFEIDRLKERVFNAYQADLVPAAAPGPEESMDFAQVRTQIQAQRERLNRMGPVNLVAIQEYDEMKERFDFLTKQQQDLLQAKEDLHKAILRINRTTREMFVETFQKVQKFFTDYYRLLFGGGNAELVLLDETDVLESGIEITARPPGKKLQVISLLSGGEKALTAIALLFALFKVKPSPFCVLDEIDAPLDESNIERFCRVLKDFVTESQFILITHSKRTMNLSDAMYGITMAETGVSKIVSVRFSEKKKQGQAQPKEVLV